MTATLASPIDPPICREQQAFIVAMFQRVGLTRRDLVLMTGLPVTAWTEGVNQWLADVYQQLTTGVISVGGARKLRIGAE
jgi:hypothetical protein